MALEFALALTLSLTLTLLVLSALALELVPLTTPLPWLLPVLSSVGMVVLNASVMETAGARTVVATTAVAAVVSGVFVPTMLVRPCVALLSSDSVLTSTLNGWVCAHVCCEDCALVKPRRLNSAEFLNAVRRIFGSSLGRERLDGLSPG